MSYAFTAEPSLIQDVKQVVKDKGWEFFTAGDVFRPGDDIGAAIEKAISEADGYVLLDSKLPSRSLISEAQTAQSLGKPIVSLGEGYTSDSSGFLTIESSRELGLTLDKWKSESDDIFEEHGPGDD